MATTIYSGGNDGYILGYGPSFTITRDLTTANVANTILSNSNYAVRANVSAGRGGTTYYIQRSFFEFDVSSISHVPKDGTLQIRGSGFGNAEVIAVKGTQSFSLSTNDFNNIAGWESGSDGAGRANNASNITDYGGTVTSWSTSGYNTFTLTQQALADIAGESLLKVCLVEVENDLKDQTPTSGTNYSGLRFSEYSGTGSDPRLIITEQHNSVSFGTNF